MADTENLVAPEDQEIIDHQLTGVESEKEAADLAVARMLREEADKGNGQDPAEVERGEDGKPLRTAEVKEPGPAETEESNNQRRRRLQREAAQRTRDERDDLRLKVSKLEDRLSKIEAPDPQRYDENQNADYIADRSAAAARHAITQQEIEEVQGKAKAADAAMERHAAAERSAYFSDGAKKYPDFQAVLTNPDSQPSVAMIETFMEEDMHDLAYALSKQPAEMNRIAALPSPALQIKELLKAQAALEAKAVQTTTSKAPPPIKPVRAAGAGQTKSPSDMSYKEYVVWRQKSAAG